MNYIIKHNEYMVQNRSFITCHLAVCENTFFIKMGFDEVNTISANWDL